ncbi:VOC family protein [Brevundimonas bacteroides]|uniref:VOC family protein n=1 Tax=Brevundimonas bacteroides TaxID=74311 RepID=UPI00049744D4|nr:VOC family protein [Brevundimonas bacteroides]
MSLPADAIAITFILTKDRAVADAFYRDTLGLTFVVDDGFGAVFDLNGATLRITHVPDHAAGGHPALGWRVSDIRSTIAALKAKRVEMTIYPGMGQDPDGVWTSPDGRAKVAFFADPDGNVLSLTQD